MSDYISASIEIGGGLTPDTLDALAEAIWMDGPSLEWEDNGISKEDAKLAIQNCIEGEHPLRLTNSEADSGEFEEIEKCCRELQLTYRRHTSAKWEWDSSITWWKPGMAEPVYVLSNEAGCATILLADVEEALERGEEGVRELLAKSTPLGDEVIPPLTFKESE